MERLCVLFLLLAFSDSTSCINNEWICRESRSILGRPRLDPTGRKQVGLDVFVFNKEVFIDSFIRISNCYIQYDFEDEVSFNEDSWYLMEIPAIDLSSEDDLDMFLASCAKESLIPKILKTKPKKLEVNDKTHITYELKTGTSFKCLFEQNAFDIDIKLEAVSEKRWKFLFNIEGFRPLTFMLKAKKSLDKEEYEKIYKRFLSNYVQFLKKLFK